MTERVRLVCPLGRKHAELWGGAAVAALGLVVAALAPTHWTGLVPGIVLVIGGAGLAWHGSRFRAPVLEVDSGEFRYTRGRYVVRIPFSDIGSYYVLPGRTRSLGLCDAAGRPRIFPSVEGRRATRPYLPLTGLVSPARIDSFMSTAGIPPRDRSLTSGGGAAS
ncbi:hypothetical protein HDA32_005381 [Spinactinospora alkalitolerans]|uniref:PH domain-containing protein n=1 Tax=Spinactinospora alkalitolerans TaxID=687207 RepID=A0A852U2B6_9ACTN|nr:hypothetical protein [Spinactinospora alkalitolerans]NYE50261.1 hypothetical protein [Spinactinospora alkalitolerans]